MDERILADEEAAPSEYYSHDTRSILSASTSSRATLGGPRQRPKGPRTSDISRSSASASILERVSLPLSPLAKEILSVSEESSTHPGSAPSAVPPGFSTPNNVLETSFPITPKPRRTSLVARFSFRRSKSTFKHEPEAVFADDPFRATPHPSVRWEAVPPKKPQDLWKFATRPTIVSLPTQSTHLPTRPVPPTPATGPGPNPQNVALLKPKRSFFRRMADIFLRSDSDPPRPQFASARDHRAVIPLVAPLFPQLPTPSSPSPASSPFSPAAQLTDPPPAHNRPEDSPRTPTRPQPSDTVSVRTLPVLSPRGHPTVNNAALREPASSPEIEIYSPNGAVYRVPSASPSGQLMTPISPARNHFHTSGDDNIGSPHTSLPYGPSSMPAAAGMKANHHSLKEKATSVRNVPAMRKTSIVEKRKAMSVRSQPIEPPSTRFYSNTRVPRVGGNWALMDLDKAMFEQELTRDRELSSPIKEEKLPSSAQEKKPAFYAVYAPSFESTISLTKSESQRQSSPGVTDLRKTRSSKPLPSKPYSAPGPSSLPSSVSKRGLAFSVNLDSSSDIHIPPSALSIDPPYMKEHRLYPDALYTASQSYGGQLSPLSDNGVSRRSLPTQPLIRSATGRPLSAKADDRPGQTHFQNGTDKVSRWLASTSQSPESDGTGEDTIPKYRDKGKGRAL